MRRHPSALLGVESRDTARGGEVSTETGGVEGDFEWKDERGTVALELGVGAQALSARLAAEAERARWIVVHGFVFTR